MALILLALAFQAILEGQQKNRGAQAPGKAAPAFRMERYDGTDVTLADLKGKVVMIDFWATWCPPCVEEMPHLVRLAKEYEKDGLVFLAANRDEPDVARYEVQRFIERKVTDLAPFVAFPTEDTAELYEVSSLPTLFFVDRQGQMQASYLGFAPEKVLRERIEAALGK